MSVQKKDLLQRSDIEQLISAPERGITGVQFKLLKTFGDSRGFFREIFRETENIFAGGHFAQWSHSRMQKDVVKAWHYHHVQYDWWYLPLGQVVTALVDFREESPTYRKKLIFQMGQTDVYGPDTHELCVSIPPGVLHGCRVLSDSAHLFYITSKAYDPGEEGRYPFNCPEVDHDWGEGAIVVENDTKYLVPVSERVLLK